MQIIRTTKFAKQLKSTYFMLIETEGYNERSPGYNDKNVKVNE